MHISIIDDEKILTNKISKKLQLNGYSVSEFYSYMDFMKKSVYKSDLYIVDISLGDGSGFEIVHFLRTQKRISVPIIIMSGFGDIQNKLFGFDRGIDDYITKPFLPEELLARIRALLRRPLKIVDTQKLDYKNLTILYPTKEVFVSGVKIELARKEIQILELFINNIGLLIEKDHFVKSIWGHGGYLDVNDNTVYVTLSKLKKKLGDDFPLQTKHNLGYILE